MIVQLPTINWKFFDHYSRRARVYPALIAVAPGIAALMILFTWQGVTVTSSVASAGLLVIFYAMSDLARQRGKRLEPRLYQRVGGMPSTRMLRRNDTTFDETAKERYRAFLADKLGRTVPTAEEEAADAKTADGFYDAGSAWLRENTRDAKVFDILFYEQIAYGFRRNLLGLKWPAATLNLVIVAIGVAQLWPIAWPINLSDDLTARVAIVLTVAVIHALYLVFGVTWRAVEDAANTYARQLILSAEHFLAKAPKPRTPKNGASDQVAA